MTRCLQQLIQTFQKRLHLPDPDALLVTLATVAANMLKGDPVWLMLVGAPGNLKTEILQTVFDLPDIYPVGMITEAGLLSGSGKNDCDADATGGLLREIGDFGIIVCKDFTSIIGMNRDKRGQLLAALREIYDGHWNRVLGSGGGKTFSWKGKVGFLGGVTPMIDTAHSVMNTMGERFVLYRMPELDEMDQARAALSHSSSGDAMRRELRGAVTKFLSRISFEKADRSPTEGDIEYLINLAALLVRARSAVIRDGDSRQVAHVFPPEAPTRVAIVLDQLWTGLRQIGVDDAHSRTLLRTIAFDCVPVIRSRALRFMGADTERTYSALEIAEDVRHPKITTAKHLEDLELHQLLERRRGGDGLSDEWSLTRACKDYFHVIDGAVDAEGSADTGTVSETSPPPITISELSDPESEGSVSELSPSPTTVSEVSTLTPPGSASEKSSKENDGGEQIGNGSGR